MVGFQRRTDTHRRCIHPAHESLISRSLFQDPRSSTLGPYTCRTCWLVDNSHGSCYIHHQSIMAWGSIFQQGNSPPSRVSNRYAATPAGSQLCGREPTGIEADVGEAEDERTGREARVLEGILHHQHRRALWEKRPALRGRECRGTYDPPMEGGEPRKGQRLHRPKCNTLVTLHHL